MFKGKEFDGHRSRTGVHNILIIKPGAIGDVLQLSPVVRALKNAFPQARISLVVGANTASLFAHNPFVHETIIFDRKGEHRSLSALARLWRRLRTARYDLVLNFQRSNLKTWLLASAAFPCKVLVYHKARNRTVHAVVNYLETVAPLGIASRDLELELHTGPADEVFADELFQAEGMAGKTVVALNPGASNRIKCWSTRQFAELGDRLVTELGVRVVLVGGREERDLADEIRSGMHSAPLDLIAGTNLLQLGAVLKRCAVLVSGDTGPMHLATAVGTPVVALFGAIDPDRTGPVGKGHRVIRHREVSCVPCKSDKCSNVTYLECMERITVSEVFDTVRQMVHEKGGCP